MSFSPSFLSGGGGVHKRMDTKSRELELQILVSSHVGPLGK